MVTYLSRSYNVCEIRTMTSTPASLASFLIAASLSFPNGSESYSIESFAMFHSYNTNQKCGPLAAQLENWGSGKGELEGQAQNGTPAITCG